MKIETSRDCREKDGIVIHIWIDEPDANQLSFMFFAFACILGSLSCTSIFVNSMVFLLHQATASISSFGFGGTNGHVVLASPTEKAGRSGVAATFPVTPSLVPGISTSKCSFRRPTEIFQIHFVRDCYTLLFKKFQIHVFKSHVLKYYSDVFGVCVSCDFW